MAFEYSEYCVVWTYHNANAGTYDPSSHDLDDWDTALHAIYEEKLQEIMPEFGITVTTENRSRVVALAEVSNGGSPGARVRNACKYYANVLSLSLP